MTLGVLSRARVAHRGWVTVLAAMVAFAGSTGSRAHAQAEPATGVETPAATTPLDERRPWADTLSLTTGWRTSVTALSFDRSADLTYDPFVAMRWRVVPAYQPMDRLLLSLSLSWQTELTQSNVTTRRREVLLDDLALRVASPSLVEIPRTGIAVSPELGLRLPTSKASQRASLVMGVSPGVSLSRSVPLLSGLTFAYSLGVDITPHRFSTPGLALEGCGPRTATCLVELDTAPQGIAGASSTGVGIAQVNLGGRNPRLGVNHTLSATLGFTRAVSFSASWTHASYWLYGLRDEGADVFDDVIGAPDAASPTRTLDPQDRRWVQVWNLALGLRPVDALRLTLGTTTAGNPRTPDNQFRDPVFNRNTHVVVDVALDVIALFAGNAS